MRQEKEIYHYNLEFLKNFEDITVDMNTTYGKIEIALVDSIQFSYAYYIYQGDEYVVSKILKYL